MLQTKILFILAINSIFFKKYEINVVKQVYFILPVKSRKMTFLRAPYKNKLAQLSLIRFEKSFIITYKINSIVFSNSDKLYYYLKNINLDFIKTKHVKLSYKWSAKHTTSFLVKNYN